MEQQGEQKSPAETKCDHSSNDGQQHALHRGVAANDHDIDQIAHTDHHKDDANDHFDGRAEGFSAERGGNQRTKHCYTDEGHVRTADTDHTVDLGAQLVIKKCTT